MENKNIDTLIEQIRIKGKAARIFANISIVIMVFIVIFLIIFFYINSTTLMILNSNDVSINISWVTEVAPILAKITSIVLAIYLIKILVGFTRYQYQVANHLDIMSFALEISNGDLELLEKAMHSLNLSHIQFRELPRSTSDKGFEIFKEAISKLQLK